jgi:hypothetical protein
VFCADAITCNLSAQTRSGEERREYHATEADQGSVSDLNDVSQDGQ